MVRQPAAAAPRRLPGAAQGRAALSTTWCPARNGGRSPVWDAIGYAGPLGPDRGRAAEGDRSRSTSTRDTTLDCDVVRGRLRRRRRHRGRRAGGGRARRRRARGRRLLRRRRLRRRRARRATARMYMYGGGAATARPERRPAGRQLPRRRHDRQLHDLVPHARRRARGVGGARRAGVRRPTSTARASTPSASASA